MSTLDLLQPYLIGLILLGVVYLIYLHVNHKSEGMSKARKRFKKAFSKKKWKKIGNGFMAGVSAYGRARIDPYGSATGHSWMGPAPNYG